MHLHTEITNSAVPAFIRRARTTAAAGGLYEGALLDEVIRRYECLWLPFLARNGGKTSCIPPLDVAYIWHVHRLDPNYSAFCQQAFGHDLVPTHPFRFSTTKNGDMIGWKQNEPLYPPRSVPAMSSVLCTLCSGMCPCPDEPVPALRVSLVRLILPLAQGSRNSDQGGTAPDLPLLPAFLPRLVTTATCHPDTINTEHARALPCATNMHPGC
jgi:hypothetical protein